MQKKKGKKKATGERNRLTLGFSHWGGDACQAAGISSGKNEGEYKHAKNKPAERLDWLPGSH